jgi:hypothetical protein
MFASSPPNSLKEPQDQLPGRTGIGGDHIIISSDNRSNGRERRHHAQYSIEVETSLPVANLICLAIQAQPVVGLGKALGIL